MLGVSRLLIRTGLSKSRSNALHMMQASGRGCGFDDDICGMANRALIFS